MKTPRHLQNLEEAYVYATEVQLGQLRELALREDSSGDRLSRQRAICLGMLRWCASVLLDHSLVDWGTQQHPSFPRVSEVLAGDGVEAGLNGLLQRWAVPFASTTSYVQQRTANNAAESGETWAH